MKILYFLFKKQIDKLAQQKMEALALESWIEKNFFLSASDNSLELQFRGRQFVKILAACFYEMVKDADNYITMDLISRDYEPMTVTIQKKWKLSPHEKAQKLEKELAEVLYLLRVRHSPDLISDVDWNKVCELLEKTEKK